MKLSRASKHTLQGRAGTGKRRAVKKKTRRPRLPKTKFSRTVIAKARELIKNSRDEASLVDTFVDIHKVLAGYHRRVKQEKGEKAQEELIPDTTEISILWKTFLKLQEASKDRGYPLDVEFAPFIVYGRTMKDRLGHKDRWAILDEFDWLPLKSLSGFTTWAQGRRKRVVTLYLNLKRDHIMALMYKPDRGNGNFSGLHKFDPNAAMKSSTDSAWKSEAMPNTAFYVNTTRVQGFQDFTCFFWCMHWIMWKMTTAARFALMRVQVAGGDALEHLVPSTLDSFRSTAYKKWASHIHAYITASDAQHVNPTSLALLLLSDPEWLHANSNQSSPN